MTIQELETKAAELEQRAAEIEKEQAEAKKAREDAEKRSNSFYGENFKMNEKVEERNISKKFLELRAGEEGLKLNDTGKDYYGTLVEAFRIDKPLTQRASFIRGSYTGFKIPLMTARPAIQAYGEPIKETSVAGRTDLTVDDQMAISAKTITPELFYSILGITYNTEKFSMVTDAEIESAFAESFSEKIENDLQSRNAGSGYAICGLLSADVSVCASGNAIETAAANTVTWADLYKLADKVKGKSGRWTIIVPSEIMGELLANSTSDYNFCKEEYLRSGKVRGIEVVEIATAADKGASKVIATVIDLNKNLKVCMAADDVMLRTVYDKNSLNKYLQGAMGLAAEVVLPSEVWQLVGKA